MSCHPIYIVSHFELCVSIFLVSHHNVKLCHAILLVSHHICEIVSCYLVWLDNINMNYFMPSFIPHYPLHLSIIQCLYFQLLFLFYQPFELESVMAVSKWVTTQSSKKIVLPVDADRTTVVLAQGPDPPHITQTLADCTPIQLDREPATPF